MSDWSVFISARIRTTFRRPEVGSICYTFLYLVFEILQIEYLVFWYFKYFFVSRCICSNTPFRILFPNTHTRTSSFGGCRQLQLLAFESCFCQGLQHK